MKKLFTLLLLLVAAVGLVACGDEKNPDEGNQPQEPEISQELKNAKDYIKNLYQAKEGKITSNLDVPANLPVSGTNYGITWELSVTSGKADAVKIEKTEDGKKYVVVVTYDPTITEEVKFTLTATIASPENETTSISFNFSIPTFEANTVAQMISEADLEKIYFIEGTITAVNKTEGVTAFVITDGTGSIFCYDGLEVKLGQKVQITGNYSAYNDAFHQLAKPQLVKVVAENQDLAAVCGTAVVTTATDINNAAKAEGATAVTLTEAYAGKLLEVTGYVVDSNGYANLAVAADAASCCNLYANNDLKLKDYIGAKVVIKGFARGVSVGNGITIQVQSVELAPGEEMPSKPDTEFEEPAVTEKTVAELKAIATEEEKKAAYIVTTKVAKLGQKDTDTAAGKYGNLWVGEGEDTILVYGATATASALSYDGLTGLYSYSNAKDFDSNDSTKDITVGDTVKLLVIRTSYNGVAQLNAIVLEVNETVCTPTVAEKTVAELKAIATEEEKKAAYIVTTKVAKLGQKDTDTAAGKYGNLWVGEGEDTILVYGATATASALSYDGLTGLYSYSNAKDFDSNDLTKDIKVGDTVKLLVIRTSYNGVAQLNAIVLEVNPQ